MAHVTSASFQDQDGIFLYQMEGDRRKRRIGGPYPSNRAADDASRLVSQMVGEAPVEDYIEFLKSPRRTTSFEGDMQLRPAPERELQGYPRGGVGGILDRVGAGIQEDVGQVKDWAGGLLSGVDWPDMIRGGYETADTPTEEQPEWLAREYEHSLETGLSIEGSEFLLQFTDALENDDIEEAQLLFNNKWPLLIPRDRDELNVFLGISEPVEYDGR